MTDTPTDGFYEVVDPHDDDVVQRLKVLTATEIHALEARGYIVRKQTFSRTLWTWLLDKEPIQ